MLKYLVILLDDASTSYCHYSIQREAKAIDIETLRKGILFAMKENLTIQFVYPKQDVSQEIKDAVETIDHTKIMPIENCDGADVVVCNDWSQLENVSKDSVCVVRIGKDELWNKSIEDISRKVKRLNVVIADVDTFTDEDFKAYETLLGKWAKTLKKLYEEGLSPQLNLLTDRMMLDKMNSCGAGDECVTLAPNGSFYVCPAFYQENAYAIGNLDDGLDIKNKQLYRLDHAPICRTCDAYQCKRCIWLNRKTTLEVNTPSHEQCVVAHLERNASRQLLADIREIGEFLPNKEIKEIDYLDPFDNISR